MRALSIVHESTGRRLVREFYPMRFLWLDYRGTVAENSEAGTVILRLVATDKDLDRTILYSLQVTNQI
jgi:hypothetical protein